MNGYITGMTPHYCPHCQRDLENNEVESLGTVEELGGILRLRCLKCGNTFEILPPSVDLRAIPMPTGYDITVRWQESTSKPQVVQWLREQFAELRAASPTRLLAQVRSSSQVIVQNVSGEERDRAVESAKGQGLDVEVRPHMR